MTGFTCLRLWMLSRYAFLPLTAFFMFLTLSQAVLHLRQCLLWLLSALQAFREKRSALHLSFLPAFLSLLSVTRLGMCPSTVIILYTKSQCMSICNSTQSLCVYFVYIVHLTKVYVCDTMLS